MSQIIDQPEEWPVTRREVQASGRVQSFIADQIDTPAGESICRQWVGHTGAVAVMAMDEQGRIAVVHQYRHPVGFRLVEPPAGILDIDGEPAVEAAKRELAEEAQLAAGRWDTLIDFFTSPGGLQESIRIFLARDLSAAPLPDGFEVVGEEIDMGLHWLGLDEIIEGIYAGELQSPTLVAGALALKLASETGRLAQLRPADAPWPARAAKKRRDQEFG
ncbi:MAG: NUDIX domain-containing protein [Brooklawnia sp.]